MLDVPTAHHRLGGVHGLGESCPGADALHGRLVAFGTGHQPHLKPEAQLKLLSVEVFQTFRVGFQRLDVLVLARSIGVLVLALVPVGVRAVVAPDEEKGLQVREDLFFSRSSESSCNMVSTTS